jgi:hypothetical protein
LEVGLLFHPDRLKIGKASQLAGRSIWVEAYKFYSAAFLTEFRQIKFGSFLTSHLQILFGSFSLKFPRFLSKNTDKFYSAWNARQVSILAGLIHRERRDILEPLRKEFCFWHREQLLDGKILDVVNFGQILDKLIDRQFHSGMDLVHIRNPVLHIIQNPILDQIL